MQITARVNTRGSWGKLVGFSFNQIKERNRFRKSVCTLEVGEGDFVRNLMGLKVTVN